MPWTPKQIKLAGMAASAAGWDSGRRYLALRHAGCPVYAAQDRPSAKHPRNSQDSFEAYMALAEECAESIGARVPRPFYGTWHAASRRMTDRIAPKIRQVESELVERVPKVYPRGFLPGFIARMTKHDSETLRSPLAGPPRRVEDLDAGQAYRVLEGLKAWGARELRRVGLEPVCFRASGDKPAARPARRSPEPAR